MCSDTSSLSVSDVSERWEAVSGVGTTSSGGVALDPLQVYDGFIARGFEAEKAIDITTDWLAALKVHGDGRSRRQLRLDKYYEECRSFAAKPGGCYLHMMRLCRRKKLWQQLGANPRLSDVLACATEADYDDAFLESLYIDAGDGENIEDAMHLHVVNFYTVVTLREYLTAYSDAHGLTLRFRASEVRKGWNLPRGVFIGMSPEPSELLGCTPLLKEDEVLTVVVDEQDHGDGILWGKDDQRDRMLPVPDTRCTMIMSLERYAYAFYSLPIQAAAVLVVCDKRAYLRIPPLYNCQRNHFALCYDHLRTAWVITTMSLFCRQQRSGIMTNPGLTNCYYGIVYNVASHERRFLSSSGINTYYDVLRMMASVKPVSILIESMHRPQRMERYFRTPPEGTFYSVSMIQSAKSQVDILDYNKPVQLAGRFIVIPFSLLLEKSGTWDWSVARGVVVLDAPVGRHDAITEVMSGMPSESWMETCVLATGERGYVLKRDYGSYPLLSLPLRSYDMAVASFERSYRLETIMVT